MDELVPFDEVDEEIEGVDSRDKVKHNKRSDPPQEEVWKKERLIHLTQNQWDDK